MRPNAGTTYLKHPIPIVQHQQFHPIPKPPNPNTKQPGIRPGTSESNEALQWLCQAKHVSWRVKEMMSLACWFGPIVLLVVSGEAE
ncbi:hypothetical protein AFLA_001172 [Aspergillus flavus NRRL3357]|nr:hypothetical protein AFLA_001172 [Aspergillus flavus NRRL3357]